MAFVEDVKVKRPGSVLKVSKANASASCISETLAGRGLLKTGKRQAEVTVCLLREKAEGRQKHEAKEAKNCMFRLYVSLIG